MTVPPSFKTLIAIGLLSAAMIAYQLCLTQYLSIAQWHHFAYMIISIALLGFGAAGTAITLLGNRLLAPQKPASWQLLSVLMVLSGVFMPISIWLSGLPSVRFDTYLLFVEHAQIWQLLLNYLFFFLSFFFCALAIGIMFIKHIDQIGNLYFSNLAGSGLGGLVAIALFWTLPPSKIFYITGIMAVASGFMLIPFESLLKKGELFRKKRNIWLFTTFILVIIFLVLGFIYPPRLVLSEYKALSKTLHLPEAVVELEKNSPYGWVQYVSSPALRYAPGLSLAYAGKIPVADAIFNNGEWYGPVLSENEDDLYFLDYMTSALAWEIAIPQDVLILNAGTGIRTKHAVMKGAANIYAVEPHSLIVSIVNKTYKEKDTSVSHKINTIRLYTEDARSFLAKSTKKYNLISLPPIGAFGGTTGLYAMQEEYLLTTDAFSQLYNGLKDDGIIEVTAWMDYPYRNPIKIAATIAELLKQKEVVNMRQQVVAIRSWGTITFVIKKTPFSEQEIRAARNFCKRLFFDPLLLPDITNKERTAYNHLDDLSLLTLTDAIFSNKREEVYKTYDFYVRPASDDRPYFSQFLRWKSFPHLQRVFGNQSASFFELGYLMVLVTFIQSFLLAIVLIILPLFRLRMKKDKPWTILYFSGIGIGFMFVEIVLIQRFILYLGNPVYSVSAVICGMLLMSGIGSYLSSKLRLHAVTLRKITIIIVCLLLLYSLLLPLLLKASIGFSFSIKILISIILIGIPAFLMGMPFPLGLRYISKKEEANVPWAWGINGCLSVIGAVLATIIALESGYTALMLFAVLAYFITFVSCLKLKQ